MKLMAARLWVLLLFAIMADSASIDTNTHKDSLPAADGLDSVNSADPQGHENVGARKARHFDFGGLGYGGGFDYPDYGYGGYGGYGGYEQYGYGYDFDQFGYGGGYYD